MGEECCPEPVDQAGPIVPTDQDDGETGDLPGLDQGEGFEQLIQSAQAAGEDDEAAGVLDEHRLASEEVAKVDPEVDVVVEAGLER